MPLRTKLELRTGTINWNNNCVMYGADTCADGDNANNRETTFQITSTKLYIPVVTL